MNTQHIQPEHRVLWWGRFDREYSRNRILQQILREIGWEIFEFHPRVSVIGHWLTRPETFPRLNLVWVPCFRQRDFFSAKSFAKRMGVPILFDPLISSYDKKVSENKKYIEGSFGAERVRRWERRMFAASDIILADTDLHAEFFAAELEAIKSRIFVVPVGAEEDLFSPQPFHPYQKPVEVLFYGSFVSLQGADIIVEAARQTPEVNWTLLGRGKLLDSCKAMAAGSRNIHFEDWVDYKQLAARIGQADILLGIFGGTPKAARVMPNKFFQSIACARPVITQDSPVYDSGLKLEKNAGITLIPPADPKALANAVRDLARSPERLVQQSRNARRTYEKYYAQSTVKKALLRALGGLAPSVNL